MSYPDPCETAAFAMVTTYGARARDILASRIEAAVRQSDIAQAKRWARISQSVDTLLEAQGEPQNGRVAPRDHGATPAPHMSR